MSDQSLPAIIPDQALLVARWAAEHVPLYQELYGGRVPAAIEDFRALPPVTAERLAVEPFVRRVDSVEDTLRTLTPYRLATAVTPAAIALDAADTDAAFEECRDAFALLGIEQGKSVAFICAPEQRYVGAEACERLGFFGVQAHVVIGAPPALLQALAADYVVNVGLWHGHDDGPCVTVREPCGQGPDLYVVPQAGFVAVRAAGERSYALLGDHYLMEEVDGALLLTALYRFHQPLVRLLLPDRGSISAGRLWLEDVAL